MDVQGRFSLHSLIVTLLAIQFLVPPAWVKHGLDCWQRCRLAAMTGVHCPLMYGAHHAKSTHHCPEHASAMSPPELRCRCSHSSTSPSSLDVVRFVVPQGISVGASSLTLSQSVEPIVLLVAIFLTPPDPPPRSFSFIAL